MEDLFEIQVPSRLSVKNISFEVSDYGLDLTESVLEYPGSSVCLKARESVKLIEIKHSKAPTGSSTTLF